MVFRSLDDYRRRPDFVRERIEALQMFAAPDLSGLYRFIVTSTPTDAVFLASDSIGQSVVGVAGRKVVVLHKFFSNPFVDWEARNRDRDTMQGALASGDWRGFVDVAAAYDVQFVVTEGRLPSETALACCLRVAWESGGWIVYAVRSYPLNPSSAP